MQQQQLITPNFNEVSDRITPGVYKMRIVDSKVDTWTGKDGKPNTTFIAWSLETFGEGEDKNNGRRYTHRTPTEGKGAFRLKDFYFAAMGEECAGAFDPSMLYGRELEVTIADQTNNPQYTEVKSVRALSH